MSAQGRDTSNGTWIVSRTVSIRTSHENSVGGRHFARIKTKWDYTSILSNEEGNSHGMTFYEIKKNGESCQNTTVEMMKMKHNI